MTDYVTAEITSAHIKELLVEEGYEVRTGQDPAVFQVKDLESGLTITCVLQENILFNTLPCFSLSAGKISPDLMHTLLDAENGISTSSFQLYKMPDDQVTVTLNNFCKLQNLGAEDRDDLLSCLSFLEVDSVAARRLLARFL